MAETEGFLSEILPRLRAAEWALHRGDAGPRCELWSREEPVTPFGAEVTRAGRQELESTFEWVASRCTECLSLEYEVIAAGASGDLAYLAAIERISARANGVASSYASRATTIFRREGGTWRAIHRHGDPYTGT